ncbi:unnamed protein product [Malus baccata var. baccata]
MSRPALFIIFLVLQLVHLGSSRIVRDSGLISDGINDETSQSSIVEALNLKADSVTCEPIYGFLPCATSVWGLLFLIIVYEVLLSLADHYISRGSEIFFELFGTGIFGASAFHLLGLIPQVGVVLVDWFTISKEIEKCKIIKSFSSGVRTDVETRDTARIMMLSSIPYLFLQLAKILTSTTAVRVVILISLLIASAILATYIIYQFFQPWIQSRRLEYLMLKYIRKILPSLLTVDGNANESSIKELFHRVDKNHNTYISADELKALILGIQIEEIGLDDDDYAEEVMKQFDLSGDAQLTETEFVNGISKWINPDKTPAKNETSMEDQQIPLIVKKKKTRGADTSWMNLLKAAFLITLGTAITVFLSMPLMVSLQEFSTAASIPSFMASYVVIPLATNYRLALMSVLSAKHKTENAISLTLSEIYNAAFMNNIVGLIIFLALVYIRNLSWNVAAEVLVVLIISIAVGLSASFSRTFPFWTSILAYILYPISLLLVYVLTIVIGWS